MGGLEIEKRPVRENIVYVRFSKDELSMVKKVAARYQFTKSEAVRALVLKAFRSVKVDSGNKKK